METGILLINTGSPDSPAVPDVRRYLSEFLMDGRVIDLPFAARAAVVYGCVLPFRPRRSAEAYRRIWTPAGSPLVVTSQRLCHRLRAELNQPVELAMRYGSPSARHALAKLAAQNVSRVLVLPMFPHYAMSSYESAVAHVRKEARTRHPELDISAVAPYYDDPRYIDALVHAVGPQLTTMPDHVLFSFHGMPVRHLRKAGRKPHTCYLHQTRATVHAFLKRSGWPEERASIAYQSRFGPDCWLEPFTHVELDRLAPSGVRNIAVICPSFTVDCLETLEEIAIRGRETFLKAGGAGFTMIPAPNDSIEWVHAIAEILSHERAREPVLTNGSMQAPSRTSTSHRAGRAGLSV